MTQSTPNLPPAASQHAASFRDPSGFLFQRDGQLFRQINRDYQPHYEALQESGLYDELVKAGLLVRHEEVKETPAVEELAYCIIRPERIPFVSYPYEWSFGQYQDAALLTLDIQQRALEKGMILKDASAYNIQFLGSRPVLIDTLSFEIYKEGSPWIAYRQFCQHFLAPLSLMANRDIRLGQLMRVYIDGLPLDLASRLLPARSRLNFPLLFHVHMHAASQKRYADRPATLNGTMSKTALLGLLDSLKSGVQGLRWNPQGTEWGDYYEGHNYTQAGLEHKQRLVEAFIDRYQPHTVWDLGANTGLFSRIASSRGVPTVAFDIDPAAVEQNYRQGKKVKDENLLPLLLDLTNPSPGLGWNHEERSPLVARGPAGALLALALVHHLAISNNVPLGHVASFFRRAAPVLCVEFVPKSDSQVQRLLSTRQDIFPSYTIEGFEKAFTDYFRIERVEAIQDSERRLYWMEAR